MYRRIGKDRSTHTLGGLYGDLFKKKEGKKKGNVWTVPVDREKEHIKRNFFDLVVRGGKKGPKRVQKLRKKEIISVRGQNLKKGTWHVQKRGKTPTKTARKEAQHWVCGKFGGKEVQPLVVLEGGGRRRF